MRLSHEQMSKMVADVEPALEFSMRQHPFVGLLNQEGMRLKGSVCGFACQALGLWLGGQGIKSQLMIGRPVKDESIVPSEMRQHVVIETEAAIIDPTYGQFMKMIAPEGSKLPWRMYPKCSIAYIPKGQEKRVGEAYADFSLEQRRDLRDICRYEVGGVSMEHEKLYNPTDEQLQEAFGGLWSAGYEPFVPDEGGILYISRAVEDIYDHMEGRTDG